jgi:hypothetical protein
LSGFWLVSYAALWVVVIGILLFELAIVRELALLRHSGRARPSGQPQLPTVESDGPEVGSALPDIVGPTANGYGNVSLRRLARHSDTLVAFISPMCEACQDAVGHLNVVSRTMASTLGVLVVMRGNRQACYSFLNLFPIDAPVLLEADQEDDAQFKVQNNPFALLYDDGGRLIRKGFVGDSDDIQALLGNSAASERALGNVHPRPSGTDGVPAEALVQLGSR